MPEVTIGAAFEFEMNTNKEMNKRRQDFCLIRSVDIVRVNNASKIEGDF